MKKFIILVRNKYFCSLLICFITLTFFQIASAKWGLEQLSTGLPKGTPAEFISQVINYILGFVGILLMAMLIYGGFMYLTSAGNEKQIESAKKVLTYAIIGIVIIFASYLIANYTIQALTSTGTTQQQGEKETNSKGTNENLTPNINQPETEKTNF